MDKSKQKYGISTWIFEDKALGINEALSRISDSGFKCIEIWGNLFHLDPRVNPDIKSIKEHINKLDLWVHSIHAPFTGLNIGYPDVRLEKEWLRVIGESLEYGVKLGAGLAVVHSYSCTEIMEEEMIAESREIIREFIKKLGRYAEELGIQLAVENQLPFNTPPFIRSLTELNSLFSDCEIGFCLDIGHLSVNKIDIESELESAGKRLLSVHVSNNDGMADLHNQPAEGVLDWNSIKIKLETHGYKGPYILEIRGGDNPDYILDQLKLYVEQ